MWRPGGGPSRLTWRRLRVLVDALPPESATKAEVMESLPPEMWAGREQTEWGPWSRTDHLLAQLSDQLAQLRWVTVAAHSTRAPDQPEPMPRPGVGMPPRIAAQRRAHAEATARLIEAARGGPVTTD